MKNRSTNGYSVVLVSSLGLILVMAALAVASGLIQIYRSVAAQNLSTQCQQVAELGVQYAMNKLSTSTKPDDYIMSPPIVPKDLLNNADVTIKISGTPAVLDKASPPYDTANKLSIDARIVTSEAKIGFSKAKVICMVQTIPTVSLNQLPDAQSLSAKSYFNDNALFGASLLSLRSSGGRLSVKSETGTLKAQIGSNQSVAFSGDTAVDGDVIASNSNGSASSITGSSENKIYGNLKFNGKMTNSNGSQLPPFLSDSFQNRIVYGSNNVNVYGDGQVGQRVGQVSPQAAPNDFAPTSTPDAGQVQFLGDIDVQPGTVKQLAPGNYVASSLTVQPGGKLEIVPNLPGQSPPPYDGVVLNITNTSNKATAISIEGSGISNQLGTQNFQVFYSGSSNVNMSMSRDFPEFFGLLYAPNASVGLSMSGQKFHGAIASDSLSVNGFGTLLYDPASTGKGLAPTNSAYNNTTNNLFHGDLNRAQPQYYQIQLWNEPVAGQ